MHTSLNLCEHISRCLYFFFHSPYSTYIGKCVSVLFFSHFFSLFQFLFWEVHSCKSQTSQNWIYLSGLYANNFKRKEYGKAGDKDQGCGVWEWNKQCKNKGCLWIQAMIEQIEVVPEQQLYWNWIGYAADI